MTKVSQAKKKASSQANVDTAADAAQAQDALVYEVGFHLTPSVPETEVGSVVDALRTILITRNAEVISEKAPEKMTLAYIIERSIAGKREKYRESYFGFIKFAMAPSLVPEVEKTLRDLYQVLRFVIVHTTREEVIIKKRAVFTSDRLEGATIQKPATVEAVEKKAPEVSEEELDKSIDALTTL